MYISLTAQITSCYPLGYSLRNALQTPTLLQISPYYLPDIYSEMTSCFWSDYYMSYPVGDVHR